MGTPFTSVNCFEGDGFLLLLRAAADMRVPKPAAGMITLTFMNGGSVYLRKQAAFSTQHSSMWECQKMRGVV
jgi:hypothetical protein